VRFAGDADLNDARIRDRRQYPIVDLDPLGRVARPFAALGNDKRQRVANVAHQEIERRMGSLYRMCGSGRRIDSQRAGPRVTNTLG